MSERPALVIFDFDKTLVARDSFRLFGHVAASGPVERLLLFAYAAVSKIGLISNRRYKELVLERVWRGRTATEREATLDRLLAALRGLVVAPAVEALESHVRRGDVVAVVTASPDFYVAAFMAGISEAAVVRGSQIVETEEGVRVANLRGERKAEVAADLRSRSGAGPVHVYTDHVDDLALMRMAQRITLVDPPRATIAAVDRAGLSYEILAT